MSATLEELKTEISRAEKSIAESVQNLFTQFPGIRVVDLDVELDEHIRRHRDERPEYLVTGCRIKVTI